MRSEMNKTRKYFDAEIETMDRDKLEALQLRRLKAQLKRCYRDSEFYRQKFQEAGVKPDDVRTISDIIYCPFVTKTELRDEQLAFPPFGRHTATPRKPGQSSTPPLERRAPRSITFGPLEM